MNTIEEIEQAFAAIKQSERYAKVKAEHDRLLKIMGNVDGDECLLLAILADAIE